MLWSIFFFLKSIKIWSEFSEFTYSLIFEVSLISMTLLVVSNFLYCSTFYLRRGDCTSAIFLSKGLLALSFLLGSSLWLSAKQRGYVLRKKTAFYHKKIIMIHYNKVIETFACHFQCPNRGKNLTNSSWNFCLEVSQVAFAHVLLVKTNDMVVTVKGKWKSVVSI